MNEFPAQIPEPDHTTLGSLHATLLALLPTATEGISYRIPTVFVDALPVAGYAAFTAHCSYFPFSGRVLSALADDLTGFAQIKNSLHFPVDHPLDSKLVERLVDARLAEIADRAR